MGGERASRWGERARALVGVGLAVLAAIVAEQLSAAQPPSQPASEPGPPAATAEATPPEAPPAGTYSAVSYGLSAELDPVEHRVKGSGVIRWTNRSSKPQKELYFHLYLNAFKNERSVFMRSTAGVGFRGDDRPATWGYIDVEKLFARELNEDLWPKAELNAGGPEDETDARVPLPREIAPGETLTLEVAWLSALPRVTHRTGYARSFHMVAQWFPKLAVLEPDGVWSHFPFMRLSEFYADYGDYDVSIDAPASFKVGATGKLVDQQGGERVVSRYQQKNVHDFAFTAWDGFAEKTGEGPGGVKMRVLYPAGADAIANIELQDVAYGLEHFGKAYGPYPYETITIVHPPDDAVDAGGMEYPTLITTGGSWHAPLLGGRTIEGVTLHELGHQWFYGMIGTNENAWAFLDEGITTWITLRAAEERYGRGAAFDGLGLKIDHASFLRMRAADGWAVDEVAQPIDAFATGNDYGRLVYARTAVLIETVRRVWGPEKLEAAIGDYARKHRFGHPTPADLFAAVRERVGQDAAAMLERGLTQRSWVDFSVDSFRSGDNDAPKGIFGDPDTPSAAPAADGDAKFRGVIIVRRRGDLEIPVDIEVHTEAGLVETLQWDGRGPHHTLSWTGDSEIEAVVIDPEQRVLIDHDLSNNALRSRRARIAPRVLSHLGHLAHIVMELAAP